MRISRVASRKCRGFTLVSDLPLTDQSITFDHEANSYIGATEMRKDGIAAGY